MVVILSLSDRKPVDIADEIVVMVVPDYQMLENVQKIAAALSDDPVKVQIIPFGAEMVASQIFFSYHDTQLPKLEICNHIMKPHKFKLICIRLSFIELAYTNIIRKGRLFFLKVSYIIRSFTYIWTLTVFTCTLNQMDLVPSSYLLFHIDGSQGLLSCGTLVSSAKM